MLLCPRACCAELKYRGSEKQKPTVIELAKSIMDIADDKIRQNTSMPRVTALDMAVTDFNKGMPLKSHKLKGTPDVESQRWDDGGGGGGGSVSVTAMVMGVAGCGVGDGGVADSLHGVAIDGGGVGSGGWGGRWWAADQSTWQATRRRPS